jgi:hypothetical protein
VRPSSVFVTFVTSRSAITAIGALAMAAGALTIVSARQQPIRTGFERVVAPFAVRDQAGRAHAMPMLGGNDVPRPQFVDIDGDADVDLFVQEQSNAVAFFENVGRQQFVWRSDRFMDLEIGEWYRFVDLDADGRIDLLAELPFSNIRHYRNVGTKTLPKFEFVGPLLDSDGEPLFLDRQNIPAIVDLDCDGRLDLFIGRVEGTVARFEADRPGGDRFAFVTERFEGIEIVGGIGGGGLDETTRGTMRHGANALAFADFDGDADLDLFWGDFFEPGMLLIENIGRTCSSPSFQVDPVPLPFAESTRTSGYNAPAPVDIDGDGDLDFAMGVLGGSFNPVATTADNLFFWERTDPKRFTLRTKRLLDQIDHGSESTAALADLDADGDLDLVVGNKIDPGAADAARLAIYLNDGTAKAPAFRLADTLPLADAYHFAPAFGDLDADGDLDLMLGTWNQGVLLYRNEGTRQAPRWVADSTVRLALPRGSHATPVLGDLDGDGDLDLVAGQSSGALTFYRNDGTRARPKFAMAEEQIEGVKVERRSAPALVDLDRDGRLDLVVGSEKGGAAAFRNTSSRGAPLRFAHVSGFSLALPPVSTPAVADLDGDGVLDIVSGTVAGGVVFFRGR